MGTMSTNTQQQEQSSNWYIFWGIVIGVCILIAQVKNAGPKTEAQEYRELREHDEAKRLGHESYQWKKENLGR